MINKLYTVPPFKWLLSKLGLITRQQNEKGLQAFRRSLEYEYDCALTNLKDVFSKDLNFVVEAYEKKLSNLKKSTIKRKR